MSSGFDAHYSNLDYFTAFASVHAKSPSLQPQPHVCPYTRSTFLITQPIKCWLLNDHPRLIRPPFTEIRIYWRWFVGSEHTNRKHVLQTHLCTEIRPLENAETQGQIQLQLGQLLDGQGMDERGCVLILVLNPGGNPPITAISRGQSWMHR
jgi:hypothetical protein